ncbi:pol protein [Cucumis melo var. makuwa]|uniref:Pol protein n=1 Tax=Cucumis melo var. makuwa TaxID=1194695 RepID=A0A5A7T8Y9_CUCMM|nr:pol protein [Cucumis melo var. makuwa]
MDFITGLPRTLRGFTVIWVVVDRLTKSAQFIPIKSTYTDSKWAQLYMSEIVRLHGVPVSIVFDRDARFTSKFWKGLQAAMGHFQAKCATYLKRKKKSLTKVPKKASDDELQSPTVIDTNLQSGTLEEFVYNEPKFSPPDFEELKVHSEYETLVKSVRMLSPGTQRLDNILIIQKNDRKGLGWVMFVDSMKRNVVGKENIYLPRAPKLNNVCLVEGISKELNNIRQLGDQGFRRLRLYLAYLS